MLTCESRGRRRRRRSHSVLFGKNGGSGKSQRDARTRDTPDQPSIYQTDPPHPGNGLKPSDSRHKKKNTVQIAAAQRLPRIRRRAALCAENEAKKGNHNDPACAREGNRLWSREHRELVRGRGGAAAVRGRKKTRPSPAGQQLANQHTRNPAVARFMLSCRGSQVSSRARSMLSASTRRCHFVLEYRQ